MGLYSLDPTTFTEADFQLAERERRRDWPRLHGYKTFLEATMERKQPEDKATPRPWYIKYEFNIFGPGERLVGACGGRQSNFKDEHTENIANAAFIVKAVNLFDELVGALEIAEYALHKAGISHNEIGQALTKAKED